MEQQKRKYYINKNLLSVDIYEVEGATSDNKLYMNLTDEELKKKAEELRHEGNEVNIYKFITVRKKLKYEKVKI